MGSLDFKRHHVDAQIVHDHRELEEDPDASLGILDICDALNRVIQHKAHKRYGVAENIKINFEVWVAHIRHVDRSLVNSFDCANDEKGEADAEKVYVLLTFLDMVEQHPRLLYAIDALLLRDIRQPLLEVEILTHLRIQLLLRIILIIDRRCISRALIALVALWLLVSILIPTVLLVLLRVAVIVICAVLVFGGGSGDTNE